MNTHRLLGQSSPPVVPGRMALADPLAGCGIVRHRVPLTDSHPFVLAPDRRMIPQ